MGEKAAWRYFMIMSNEGNMSAIKTYINNNANRGRRWEGAQVYVMAFNEIAIPQRR